MFRYEHYRSCMNQLHVYLQLSWNLKAFVGYLQLFSQCRGSLTFTFRQTCYFIVCWKIKAPKFNVEHSWSGLNLIANWHIWNLNVFEPGSPKHIALGHVDENKQSFIGKSKTHIWGEIGCYGKNWRLIYEQDYKVKCEYRMFQNCLPLKTDDFGNWARKFKVFILNWEDMTLKCD